MNITMSKHTVNQNILFRIILHQTLLLQVKYVLQYQKYCNKTCNCNKSNATDTKQVIRQNKVLWFIR